MEIQQVNLKVNGRDFNVTRVTISLFENNIDNYLECGLKQINILECAFKMINFIFLIAFYYLKACEKVYRLFQTSTVL